jgi:ribosomal protein L11 methyltransferase
MLPAHSEIAPCELRPLAALSQRADKQPAAKVSQTSSKPSSSNVLWRVSVSTTSTAEESVVELLQALFEVPATSYTDVETATSTITVYLPRRPDWQRERPMLAARLAQLRQFGLNVGTCRPSLAKMARKDWAESWKRHFHPLEVSRRLLIKPSWSRRRPRAGQSVVVIDPGLSFGTGQHPTTAFCLDQLAASSETAIGAREARKSFLDIGTGSGILAIAAAKLGFSPIDAFDLDRDAVRVATLNAEANDVAGLIRFRRQDVRKLKARPSKRYSFICANLISNLLLKERKRLISQLAPSGTLVLAGILKTEFAQVRDAYESSGLKLKASRTEREWRSGSFQQRVNG